MKRYLLLLAIPLLLGINVKAQDVDNVLKGVFIAFDSTRDVTKKTSQLNKLNLIAKKWSDKWYTHYYNAYGKASISYMLQDATKRDAYVDEAEVELGEAEALLGKENDEIFVLKAMIAQARMSVDGRNRWQTQGKIFEENLKKAKELNEENPRIYYLKGTSTYFTPKMFGGGAKKALPYFEKAAELFAMESDSDISKPFWGKQANDYFIGECNKKKKEDQQKTEKKSEEKTEE